MATGGATTSGLPRNAISHMISTAETMEYLFPDLWVDKLVGPRPESVRSMNTGHNVAINSIWKNVEMKKSEETDNSWSWTKTKSEIGESSKAPIGRPVSISSTSQQQSRVLPKIIEKDEIDLSTVEYKLPYGLPSIWSNDLPTHDFTPVDQRKTLVDSLSSRQSVESLSSRQSSEDGDSSDYGFPSGTSLPVQLSL